MELFQGTLDLIVLRALSTMGPLHAYALANRLANVSSHPLSLNQGTLYPALVRLEQQGLIKGKVDLAIDDPDILNREWLHKPVSVKLNVMQVGQGRPRFTLMTLEDLHE